MSTRTEVEMILLERIRVHASSCHDASSAAVVEHLANAYAALNGTSTRARFQNRPPRPPEGSSR